VTILDAEHGFLEVEPHDPRDRRADREVILLLHGLGGTKDDWRFPAWREVHWDLTRPPPDRGSDNHLTPPLSPLDHLPEFGLSPLRTDLRCWSGVLKALGHTVINYSQDGAQDTVDVPLDQLERLIVPFVRRQVLTGRLAGKRVVLLCHSRGGILARAYLHHHPDEGTQWISRLITLCSPHRGTLAPLAKQRLIDTAALLGLTVGGPVFGPAPLLAEVLGRVFGWFEESEGAEQLLPGDRIFGELAAPADVPGVEVSTFGGTSVRYARVYSFHYTPDSYVPNWSDFPDIRFDWTLAPVEVPVLSPMLDALPDGVVDDEQDEGEGDGLVADARAGLPGAPHESVPVNHAEALWDEDLFARVAGLLGTPLTAAGRVECGRPDVGLFFEPPAVTFGSVAVGGVATRTLRIRNTTGSAVTVELPASPPGVFEWTAVDARIPDGEETAVQPRFRPADRAIRTERMRIISSAAGSPHTVGLVGKGIGGFPVPPEEPLPTRLSFSPSVLNFGSVVAGGQSSRQLRIGNETGRSVRIRIAAAGSGSVFGWAGVDASLATGAERLVTVTFRPKSNAIVSGTLVVASDTASSPESISLVGKGPGGFPVPPPTG
jgi:pimeloyl-ACP methyl ester carboxylesterase